MKGKQKMKNVSLFRKVRNAFKNKKPLEGRVKTWLKALTLATALTLTTPFIPTQKITQFFNPNYNKVENVLYAQEKKKPPVKLPRKDVENAFKLGESYEVKSISLESYVKDYLKYLYETSLYVRIFRKRGYLGIGSSSDYTMFSPYYGSKSKYKNSEYLKMLRSKGINMEKEDFCWFFGSYLLYLKKTGGDNAMKPLFNEYKKFIETKLRERGINMNVRPGKGRENTDSYFKVIFELVDENGKKIDMNTLPKEEQKRIAEIIADLTAEFNYDKLVNDPNLAGLKEIFEDFLKIGDKRGDGFKVYEFSVETQWGEKYDFIVSLDIDFQGRVELGITLIKENENGEKRMVTWVLKTFGVDEITGGEIGVVREKMEFPIKLGVMTEREGDNILSVGFLISHNLTKGKGTIYVISIYNNGLPRKGGAEFLSLR